MPSTNNTALYVNTHICYTYTRIHSRVCAAIATLGPRARLAFPFGIHQIHHTTRSYALISYVRSNARARAMHFGHMSSERNAPALQIAFWRSIGTTPIRYDYHEPCYGGWAQCRTTCVYILFIVRWQVYRNTNTYTYTHTRNVCIFV